MASVCVGNQFTVVSGKLTVAGYRVQGTGLFWVRGGV